jgi:pyridinium-3,5-bisthiocarboxylic acid mononucleotide nickel chelatase
VLEMLNSSNIPFVQEEVNTELVTPTGIGIIKSISSGYGKMPAMNITSTGYGLGKRETGRFNALRVILGEMNDAAPVTEKITVLESNIDNMTPEALGFAMEQLFTAGAVDVFFTPVYMKKNRPAVLLTALSPAGKEPEVLHAFLKHTTTLGVRVSVCSRYCMAREIKRVKTKFGNIRVKHAKLGEIVKCSPEFEDCREAAIKYGVPLEKVYSTARKAAEGKS